jgi:glyoxylate/hydroxypyruvate reductase A
VLDRTAGDPTIRYAVVWKQRGSRLSGLPNLKAIFSVGAGVDHLFADPAAGRADRPRRGRT